MKRPFAETISRVYLAAFAVLLLAVYPLAAVPFVRFGQEYEIAMPAHLLLTALGIPVILTTRSRLPRWLLVAVAVLGVSVGISYATAGRHGVAAMNLLALALVPWAVAVAVGQANLATERWLYRFLGVFWLLQAVSGMVDAVQGVRPIGLAGNPNWMSALILGLAPWAILAIGRELAPWWARRERWLVAGLVVAVPTVIVLKACDSRGAWLALGLMLVWGAWLYLRWRLRLLFAFFLVLLGLTAITFRGESVVRAIQHDVRVPLYGRTMAMAADHDVTTALVAAAVSRSTGPWHTLQAPLGVGPGNFRQVFTPYRANSTYGKRLVSAAVTIHPHNEFLHLASTIGLAAALAWLALLWPVFAGRFRQEPLVVCARLGCFFLIVQGMFDMTLVQPPTSFLMLGMLGICWTTRCHPSASAVEPLSRWRRPLAMLSLLLLIPAVYTSARVMTAQALVRRADSAVNAASSWRLAAMQATDDAQVGKVEARRRESAEEATRYYEASLKIDPDQVYAAYQLARLKRDEGDMSAALAALGRVLLIDPNYAHVNTLLRGVYLHLGEVAKARYFADRERQLFPYSPEAWQEYFNCVALTSDLTTLRTIPETLDAHYLLRAELLHEDRLPTMVDTWWSAVGEGEPAVALDAARALIGNQYVAFNDPLVGYLVTGDNPRQARFLHDGYNLGDYLYWRQLWLLAAWRRQAPAAPEARFADLASHFVGRLRPQPEVDRFDYLEALLAQGGGAPMALYGALVYAARQYGFWAEIVVDADQRPVAAVVWVGDTLMRLDLAAGSVTALPLPLVLPEGERTQAFFYLQEYLLKNRILGLYCRAVRPDFEARFDYFPVLVLWSAVALHHVALPPYPRRLTAPRPAADPGVGVAHVHPSTGALALLPLHELRAFVVSSQFAPLSEP